MVHLLVPTPKQKAFPPETLLALLLWRPRASSSSIPVIPNTPAAHELFGQARRFIVDYPGERHGAQTGNVSRGGKISGDAGSLPVHFVGRQVVILCYRERRELHIHLCVSADV